MGLQSPRNLYRTVKYPGRIFINFLNHIQLTSVYPMVGPGVAIAQLVTNYYIRISKEKKTQHFLKRKFKQWWSTIPPISTKTSIHFLPQIIEHRKQTTAYDANVGDSCAGLRQAQHCGRVKPVNGISNSPILDNWIFNGNTHINKWL